MCTQVLPLITDCRNIMSAIQSYLCALFAVYVAQGTLELQLDRLHDPAERSLSSVVQQVLCGSMKSDEHVIKLIQVCNDMFEDTADPALRNIYTLAACTVISYPLSFE